MSRQGSRDQFASLHGRIRQIIEQVDGVFRKIVYQDADNLVQDLPSLGERERAATIIQADKEINVSYETLRLTVDYFSELNRQALERTRREPSPKRQRQMMFGDAIMIYELADFVIGFIRVFSPDGLVELDSLQVETLRRIHRAKEEQNRLEARACRTVFTRQRAPKYSPALGRGLPRWRFSSKSGNSTLQRSSSSTSTSRGSGIRSRRWR